jgi:hypothetical protein
MRSLALSLAIAALFAAAPSGAVAAKKTRPVLVV